MVRCYLGSKCPLHGIEHWCHGWASQGRLEVSFLQSSRLLRIEISVDTKVSLDTPTRRADRPSISPLVGRDGMPWTMPAAAVHLLDPLDASIIFQTASPNLESSWWPIQSLILLVTHRCCRCCDLGPEEEGLRRSEPTEVPGVVIERVEAGMGR